MNRDQILASAALAARFLRRLTAALFGLWARVFRSCWLWGAGTFSAGSLRQRLFLLANALLFVFAVPGWIAYRSSLIEGGAASVSSHWKLAFLVVPIVSILCGLAAFSFRRVVFLVLHGGAGALLLGGFVFPGTVHTDMLHRADYQLAWSVYCYATLWAGVLVLGPATVAEAPLDRAWLDTVLFGVPGASANSTHSDRLP